MGPGVDVRAAVVQQGQSMSLSSPGMASVPLILPSPSRQCPPHKLLLGVSQHRFFSLVWGQSKGFDEEGPLFSLEMGPRKVRAGSKCSPAFI